MSIVNLVPKVEKPFADVEEILEWLDRTKERVKALGVTSIAIAWVDEKGGTGTGYIAAQPVPLLGSLEVVKREILDGSIE